jgi:hypothetical protein
MPVQLDRLGHLMQALIFLLRAFRISILSLPGGAPLACLALTNSATPLKQPPNVLRRHSPRPGLQIPLTPEISGTAPSTPFPPPPLS